MTKPTLITNIRTANNACGLRGVTANEMVCVRLNAVTALLQELTVVADMVPSTGHNYCDAAEMQQAQKHLVLAARAMGLLPDDETVSQLIEEAF